jgi:hypothetical protein
VFDRVREEERLPLTPGPDFAADAGGGFLGYREDEVPPDDLRLVSRVGEDARRGRKAGESHLHHFGDRLHERRRPRAHPAASRKFCPSA